MRILIFGYSGYIGKQICKIAHACNHTLIGAGRKKTDNLDEFYDCDFENYKDLKTALNAELLDKIDCIVFSHRVKLDEGRDSLFDLFYEKLAVELNPFNIIYEYLENTKCNKNLSIVTVTSRAGEMFASDVDYRYQIIKSAQKTAGISLGYRKAISRNVYSNAICFGEILNSETTQHTTYHRRLFEEYREVISNKRITTSYQVTKLVMLLLKAADYSLNGQTIYADSGLSKLSQDFFVRENAKS